MGLEYFKRPVFARGLQIHAASTLVADVIMSSTVSAGVGVAESVQTITLSGASTTTVPQATAVTNRGVSFITSTGTGAGWTLTLAAPGVKGMRKVVAVNTNTTVPVTLRTPSSASVFFGSTVNSIVFSTLGGADTKTVTLISQTSAIWNVVAIHPVATTASTYITFAGATA